MWYTKYSFSSVLTEGPRPERFRPIADRRRFRAAGLEIRPRDQGQSPDAGGGREAGVKGHHVPLLARAEQGANGADGKARGDSPRPRPNPENSQPRTGRWELGWGVGGGVDTYNGTRGITIERKEVWRAHNEREKCIVVPRTCILGRSPEPVQSRAKGAQRGNATTNKLATPR